MKKIILVFILVIGTSFFNIYGQTKDDDIIKLLRISGSVKLADQMMTAMIPQYKKLVPNIPDIFWDKFIEKINMDDFLHLCVPVYSKYYTHDEIKQLINFYESPLGKKMVEVAPLMSQETMLIGRKWGEKLAQDIVNELTKEGYLTY
jgi:uncharacterized protein